MAHWKKHFPSRYLQVSDLEDGPLVVTIKGTAAENVGIGEDAELKLVIKFRELEKGLVANQTRANMIEEIAGTPDVEEWPGTRIQIQEGKTSFKGKRVACLEVVAPSAQSDKEAVGF
jgi:hypothetical protein